MQRSFNHILFGIAYVIFSTGITFSDSYGAEMIVFDKPKFVSLKNNFVPLRSGPGLNYPIEWEYHAKSLPVQELAKYNGWVKIKDFDGTTGWVRRWSVSGKRTFRAIATVSLKHYPDEASSPIATIEANGIGDIISCPHTSTSFCRVEIQGYQGWLARSEIFGINHNEYIE